VGLFILHCGLKVFQPRLNVIVLVSYYLTNKLLFTKSIYRRIRFFLPVRGIWLIKPPKGSLLIITHPYAMILRGPLTCMSQKAR